MFRSLRVKLALSHAGVLTLILIVLGGAGYALLSHSLDRSVTAALTAAARAEADRVAESGHLVDPPDNDAPSAAAVRLGLFLPDGTAVGEPGERPPWLLPQLSRVVTATVSRERVRLVTVPVSVDGRLVAVAVAGRSLAPEQRLLHRVRVLGGLSGIVAVAFSVLAGWMLSSLATKPVHRAFEAQASFAADASHEFRTPLAFLRSSAELLAERDPEMGGEMLREVEYLAGVTGQLLMLARADRSSIALDLRPMPVAPACLESAERHRRAAGLRIEVRAAGDPSALMDPVAFEAALDAILENVARHGGGAATLTCERRNGRARIAISDHGPGLSPAQRARAFDRFYRADPARARAGAGLGLSLARSLVEAQRGTMWLEDTPGGGLTAVIELVASG